LVHWFVGVVSQPLGGVLVPMVVSVVLSDLSFFLRHVILLSVLFISYDPLSSRWYHSNTFFYFFSQPNFNCSLGSRVLFSCLVVWICGGRHVFLSCRSVSLGQCVHAGLLDLCCLYLVWFRLRLGLFVVFMRPNIMSMHRIIVVY
jgi:hypothetical protein